VLRSRKKNRFEAAVSDDDEDYCNIVFGVYDGKSVFMPNELVQKRIHAIGFISEKNYDDSEIQNKLKIFGNPYLYHSKEEFINSIPSLMRKNLSWFRSLR
jgi:hypothetical protein